MATVPTTHTVTDGTATSSEMNTYFRDPITFLLAPPIAELKQTAAQSIPTAVDTALLFDTEVVDSANGHSTTSNTSRYTAVYAGWYQVGGGVAFTANATGIRVVYVAVNGSAVNGSSTYATPTAANPTVFTTRAVYAYLNVGDYVEILAFQTSGGALLTTVTTHQQPNLSVRWVSN